jgi:hypothetical protein
VASIPDTLGNDDSETPPLKTYTRAEQRFGDKRGTVADRPPKRTSRPIDPILAPVSLPAKQLSRLPESFRVVVDAANTWPYPDPDTNGLADSYPSFDDDNSTYTPADIEPFSENEPWGKMESESPRAYAMFTHYKAQGLTRVMKETAKHFGVNGSHLSHLASQHNWHARIAAWDDYRERVYTNELLMGVREMAERHTEIAKKGIEAMAVIFEGIAEQLSDEDDREAFLAELSELPVRVQLAIAQKSSQVLPNLMNAERLSRGLPTEISANLHQVEHTVSLQSTDDLYSIITGLAGSIAASRVGDEPFESDIIEAEVIEADS